MHRPSLVVPCLAVLAALAVPAPSHAGPPLLLRTPSLSADRIAFAYGGDIWVVPRDGGTAHRVVSGSHRATRPVFSPTAAGSPTAPTTTATSTST